jgi:glycosyltransferase involved in cell wall biosynthesis
MEFSILIPVYNTTIQSLAEELAKQAEELTPRFQLLFIDDCSELSSSYINQKVKQLTNVEYQVLTENIGRAAIRNKLFKEAKYDLCIALDGDVSMIKNDFIKSYLSVLKEDNILVGGHVYQADPPRDPAKYLHWYYGSKIESGLVVLRQAKPYTSFMSSNFACSKQTFATIQFDEAIVDYGHEDTLFGIKAEQLGVEILHIANPVRHDGLDTVAIFLDKQQKAVRNLKELYQKEELKEALRRHSKLIKIGRLLVFGFFVSFFKYPIHKNLRGNNPNLIFLQIQKLIWWSAS